MALVLRMIVGLSNVQGRIAGRAISPFGQFVFAFQFYRDLLIASRTAAINMIAHPAHLVSQVTDHGPGDEKAWHQYEVSDGDEKGDTCQ